jgi:hypothetical protein
MAEPMFLTTVLNVARREADILASNAFSPDAVKNEFNADWGATAMLIPKKEFAGKFDRCVVVFIWKKRAGAFVFYLFNSGAQQEVLREMNGIFYALRFR